MAKSLGDKTEFNLMKEFGKYVKNVQFSHFMEKEIFQVPEIIDNFIK